MDGVPRVPEQRVPEQPVPLRFGLLGPVRAWRGEEALSTGSPQQRALLAALLLREGRTATAAELIDALWGEEPPAQALATVRKQDSALAAVRKQEPTQATIPSSTPVTSASAATDGRAAIEPMPSAPTNTAH